FHEESGYRDWIMNRLLRKADLGICDSSSHTEKVELPEDLRALFSKGQPIPDTVTVVSFIHDGEVRQALDFSNESSGTRKLFNIAGDFWLLASEEVAIFADELSASLHPRLLDNLIRAANEQSEDRRSQLIFSTHDTGLMEGLDAEPPALRRDQVYFTRKNRDGSSELYSLAEFKDDARPVHNIRKRYLSGRYGAMPNLEKIQL
ncbi:AAA family ATPase, partial [Aquisphaera insulae]|uniref:AAA family ATPase n=1 Tax=Aquisphaera insulae TaxID=2712864 RepID=UPI00196B4243